MSPLAATREAELDGAAVRRFTRRATASRADTTVFTRLGELWGNLMSVAIGVAVLAGSVGSLRDRLSLADSPVTARTLPGGLTEAVTVVLALAGLVVGLDRLGPLSSTPAAAAWWLPLPATRRSLLTGELRRLTAAVAATAVLLALPLVLTLSAPVSPGSVLDALAVVAGCAAALVGLTAFTQTRGGNGRLAPLAGGLAVGVAVLTAGAGTAADLAGSGRVGSVAAPSFLSWLAVAAAVAAVPLLIASVTGLDRLGAAQLRTLGTTSQYAAASVVSLDTRELGRALAARDRRPPRRSRHYPRVAQAWQAVVAADVTALARAPWQLGQLLTAVAVPVIVVRTDGLGALPIAVWLGCLLGWGVAAVAAGHPARLAQASPAIDRLLPLSTAGVAAARTVVPLVLSTLVTAGTGALIGVGSGRPVFWAGICAATAPAWAAASLRGAFRPDIDWSGPVVSTPMGAIPPGAGLTFVQGIDVGIVGSLPLAAALLLGSPGPGLIGVQLVWSAVLYAGALALVVRNRERRS
jgi:hypothetical protein